MLSVHYDAECVRECSACYMRAQDWSNEISIYEWVKLPFVAKKLDIEKVALAINEKRDKSYDTSFFSAFVLSCSELNIPIDLTMTWSTANDLSAYLIEYIADGIDTMTISVDSDKGFPENMNETSIPVSALRGAGVNRTCANFMITRNMIRGDCINKEIFDILFNWGFDAIHVLFEKPFPYTKEEYYSTIDKLNKVGVFSDNRFTMDPCIMLRLGLVSHCHCHNYLIDINPNGNVSGCVYNHPHKSLGKISRMEDLIPIFKNIKEEKIEHCPHLEWGNAKEIQAIQLTAES